MITYLRIGVLLAWQTAQHIKWPPPLLLGRYASALRPTNRKNQLSPFFVGAALGAVLTNFPDILEPALHPNHRQFFHSLAFAGALGIVAHKAYMWEPGNPLDESIRFVLLVGVGAYFVHLLLDATTPKSLPIFGAL